ncbi:arsenic transporter [Paenibacillus hamazuiensis]|uniref:arsenic transporter n=1 Tax=Paenibacillus hamazuiensis TaxID=2936508 RepID=UPI00200FBA70|nr:arsenic transporter [Paenibacillus hamazuiensis]
MLFLGAFAVFGVTMTLVIWQPRGLNIGWSAACGAIVALVSGIVTLADAAEVTSIVWNATLTFIALIVMSLILDELGFFEWCSLHVIRWARGNGRLLFLYTILLGAFVSCFFANDGAALILTPIVLAQVRALRLPDTMVIPFVMASGFIADTTSLPLITSNLTNIISADFFHISFSQYAAKMLVPNLFSLAASTAALFLYYRKQIPGSFDAKQLAIPGEAIKHQGMFRFSLIVLILLFLGYLFAESAGIPVCLIAGAAAAALSIFAQKIKLMEAKAILKEAPWSIIVFSIGMYLVVYGLKNAGLTDLLSGLLASFARHGELAAALGMGYTAALLSSVMNNLPSLMIGALAIDSSPAEGPIREILIYANVIGCDLGPKITPIGSLATLIWLHILSRKGIAVSWGAYFRTGLVLTVPTLLMALIGLYATN